MQKMQRCQMDQCKKSVVKNANYFARHNGETVANTPQPHVSEAYVWTKYALATMYRSAVLNIHRITTHFANVGLRGM